jgi:hypothetical protein
MTGAETLHAQITDEELRRIVGFSALDEVAAENEARTASAEEAHSFDVLASVDMLKFDLQKFGSIMPETMQRVFDEEITYMAEGLDRPLRTEFTLREHGGELAYFDNGKWSPYIGTLLTGLMTAEREAKEDPRKAFLAVRAARDLKIGQQLRILRPGERITWESDFPDEARTAYGAAFEKEIATFGFQSKRRMGFLYSAEKSTDGSVTLVSQSVDNSDHEAFTAAQRAAREGGDMDGMLTAYDAAMSQKYGTTFYAGRIAEHANHEENAWEALQQHKDLLKHYFGKLTELATRTDLQRPELEIAKKRLTYGVWAALKSRLDSNSLPMEGRQQYADDHIDDEIHRAYQRALLQGAVLFGCGASMTPEQMEEALMSADVDDVKNMIFGESSSGADCEYISKHCPSCGAKNVKTTDRKVMGNVRRISGGCGCSKVYIKAA